MKRLKIALLAAAMVVALLWLFALPQKRNAIAPSYWPVTNQPTGPFVQEQYGCGDAVPFRDGKFWLWTVVTTPRFHVYNYLYDLRQGKVIGALSNGAPDLANGDQTLLLCEGAAPDSITLATQVVSFLDKHTGGKIPFLHKDRVEAYWILDLRDNSAVRVGQFFQAVGDGSRWYPAPGFRFAYNCPTASDWGREFYLCDFGQKSLKKIPLVGDLQGWWDDHHIVVEYPDTNFFLYDVLTQQTKPLFTPAAVNQFLDEHGLTANPDGLTPLFNWNGSNFDMYLSPDRRNGLDTNATYLLLASHDGPSLKLVYTNISFHWQGYLDPAAAHLLYQGENGAPGTGGNGGVYLRNLSDQTERVIVPPDNLGQYSLARQDGDTVVFWRGKALWRVDINTTNATRLFP